MDDKVEFMRWDFDIKQEQYIAEPVFAVPVSEFLSHLFDTWKPTSKRKCMKNDNLVHIF
jgi:hypothetical protein